MADDMNVPTQPAQSSDIVKQLSTILDSEMSPTERAVICAAASEIERLCADVEQLRINLANASTGRALRDLERERADHEAIVRSLCRSLARAVMEARDLREQNAELLAQRATPRRPDITIDVGIGTAIDIIRDINRHLDNIEALTLDRKDRNDPTEP